MKTSPATGSQASGDQDRGSEATAWVQADGIPLEIKTYTIEQLSLILKRSVKSIKIDVTRNPRSLPPVFRIPGSRKIIFRHLDVLAWMDGLSFEAEQRREAEAAAQRPASRKPARHRSK